MISNFYLGFIAGLLIGTGLAGVILWISEYMEKEQRKKQKEMVNRLAEELDKRRMMPRR